MLARGEGDPRRLGERVAERRLVDVPQLEQMRLELPAEEALRADRLVDLSLRDAASIEEVLRHLGAVHG